MRVLALLALAGLADAVTRLLLPPGAELNPVAASMPLLALVLKALLVVVLLAIALRGVPHFRTVAAFGAGAWLTGALYNLAVIWRS